MERRGKGFIDIGLRIDIWGLGILVSLCLYNFTVVSAFCCARSEEELCRDLMTFLARACIGLYGLELLCCLPHWFLRDT